MAKAIFATLLLALASAPCIADDAKPTRLIGYTEGRNDLPGGQFVNWVTNRACVVRADGTGRRVLAQELTRKEHSWTQFAGWSPDGKVGRSSARTGKAPRTRRGSASTRPFA